MPQLYAEVRTLDNLSVDTRRDMYTLYASFYDATSRAIFEDDLANKTHAVLLRDGENTLRGFTSLSRYIHSHDGSECQVVYSGDTIIHQQFWGEQSLPESWIELTGRFKAEHPTLPLYWFLIVKGHRTYRYLSIFSKRYFPNYCEKTPCKTQALMNQLAIERFPEHYDAETGLIQFPSSRGHLNAELVEIPENTLKRREVQFFLERNPGYHHGDELVCITELSTDNLSRRARAYFEKGLKLC